MLREACHEASWPTWSGSEPAHERGTQQAHRVGGLGGGDARGLAHAGAAKGRRAGTLAGLHRRAQARQDVGCDLQMSSRTCYSACEGKVAPQT